MKFVVIFIQAFFFLVAFQNCAKKPVSNEYKINQTLLKLFSSQTEITVGSHFPVYTEFSINLGLDRVSNRTTGASCSLSYNQNYLSAKKLFLENGICSYSYEIPTGVSVCMAVPMPYATVNDGVAPVLVLSADGCSAPHNSLCGSVEQKKSFENTMGYLIIQLADDTACL